MTEKDLVKGAKVVFTDAKAHEEEPQYYPPVGTVGTVLHNGDDWIQWPKGSTSMDDIWCAPVDVLKLATEMSARIIIFSDPKDGRKIVAKNELTGKVGVARCNPEDEFDWETGAKLALERLFEAEKSAPAKSKFKVGEIVVGNHKANRYGITTEGWIGEVTRILDKPVEGHGCDTGHMVTFYAKPVNSPSKLPTEFDLCDDAFERLGASDFAK